jgi:D-erythronate 2-dehydrogenase
MKILITGGAGFVGRRLATTLLARGTLAGRRVERIVLADQVQPPPGMLADARVQAWVAPLLGVCTALREDMGPAFDGVFHLASAVSGECEADFDLGLTSNLDSTRALLDALRYRMQHGGAGNGVGSAANPTRLVFSSSIAVFGPDPAYPFPKLVGDDSLTTPQTSYGVQKLICEHLIADYTRKGYVDGRAARLVTVTVRPGRPNGAASSFFSGIIREPLAGEEAVLPVSLEVSHPVASPQRMVDGLIAVYEASREAFNGRTAMTMPGLNVTVQQMLDALEAVAGPKVRARVRLQRDERIAGIVANWPSGVRSARANALGLQAETDFKDIIRQYIADCADTPAALKGMA